MKAAKRHAGGKWSVMSSAEVRADSSLFLPSHLGRLLFMGRP